MIRLSLFLIFVGCHPLSAQTQCAPAAELASGLERQFGEVIQSAGLSVTGALIQTYANLQTGTWTVVATGPAGSSCIVAHGEAFQDYNIQSGEPT